MPMPAVHTIRSSDREFPTALCELLRLPFTRLVLHDMLWFTDILDAPAGRLARLIRRRLAGQPLRLDSPLLFRESAITADELVFTPTVSPVPVIVYRDAASADQPAMGRVMDPLQGTARYIMGLTECEGTPCVALPMEIHRVDSMVYIPWALDFVVTALAKLDDVLDRENIRRMSETLLIPCRIHAAHTAVTFADMFNQNSKGETDMTPETEAELKSLLNEIVDAVCEMRKAVDELRAMAEEQAKAKAKSSGTRGRKKKAEAEPTLQPDTADALATPAQATKLPDGLHPVPALTEKLAERGITGVEIQANDTNVYVGSYMVNQQWVTYCKEHGCHPNTGDENLNSALALVFAVISGQVTE